jgi:hypothetical protein
MSTAVLIPMHDVESSLLKQIGYHEDSFTLAARFLPGKKSPAGKVYHYRGVSEEIWDDIENPKNGMSVGEAFTAIIKKNPDKYPYVCVDEGLAAESEPAKVYSFRDVDAVVKSNSIDFTADGTPVPAQIIDAPKPTIIPDDEEGLKTLAMTTRAEVTALTITTAAECEAASIEVLRVREQRKLAIEKVNKIKIPATQAWQAACALFNEIDGRYAEAERYLDGGILAYRAAERKRAADEAAALRRQEDERRAAAIREQQAQFKRDQEAAEAEAKQKADELAKADAAIARAQGEPEEKVNQILANPFPMPVRHVAPPPLAFTPAPPPIVQQSIPRVAGLSYSTEWFYTITDESQIPLTHEFYSLDPKKINAKVQSLKKHANIPGVDVDSREIPIKKVGKR